MPDDAEHIWAWFWEIDSGRGSNGFGLNPIAWADIEAWARCVGAEPEHWECRTLKAMDRAMLNELAKRTLEETAKRKSTR